MRIIDCISHNATYKVIPFYFSCNIAVLDGRIAHEAE